MQQWYALADEALEDATTLIAAAPSTKNQAKAWDPEMHQTKKGNAWHFGMKAHIGVDASSGLVHTVVGTVAHVADVAQAHALLHGEEKAGFGDAGYQGVARRPEIAARFGHVRWFVAAKRGQVKALAEGKRKELTLAFEKAKARMRAYVEHPFHVVKNLFKHRRHVTGAWPRTRRNSTPSLPWPTWCSSNARCARKPRPEPSEASKNVQRKPARRGT